MSNFISEVSDVFTVIAFLFAVYVYFNWKKQLEFNLIFDLEDKFDLVIDDFTMEFDAICALEYTLIKSDNKLTKEAITDYENFQKNKVIKNAIYEYLLALRKIKRIFPDIDKDCKYINGDNIAKLYERIQKESKLRNNLDISKEDCLSEDAIQLKKYIVETKTKGNEYLEKFRKKI